MNYIQTLRPLEGVKIFACNSFEDERGSLKKIFYEQLSSDLNFDIKEVFYTISKDRVFRGMHLQSPPHESDKVVHVAKGAIQDFLLDLRPQSSTFNNFFSLSLSALRPQLLFVPKGVAHGYLTKSTDNLVVYLMNMNFCSSCDSGVNGKTILSKLGLQGDFVMSNRDSELPTIFQPKVNGCRP